jgi:UDP-N-acetylmuramoyl-tripeptide--D-alanyl-D-alanine ligase
MMDMATAALAVGGRIVGDNVRFERVTTDSRTLRPGDLFVALPGERFDGHDFVAKAFERGAAGALVGRNRAQELSGNLIVVENTPASLGALAGFWRDRFSIPLIVVVGSNGKTTVKEMLATILRAHFGAARVLATRGNLNNAIGLPLTLLELSDDHCAAVVELGMNHRGETAELAAIARPTVAVVNNAQREHQEFMRSIADVAAEHADLIHTLPADGVAVLNADDAFVDVWREAAHRKGVVIVEFALDHPAAIRGRYAPMPAGGALDLATPAGDVTVRLATFGRHNAANALAAATGALAVGVPLAAVVRGLESFRPVAGRLVRSVTADGATIIDDSYNANPDSVRAAIDVLAAAPPPRWLVLGDMGEVGARGPAWHREIGEHARRAGIERLLTAGTQSVEAAAAFGPGAEHFASVEELAARVTAQIAAGITVLVKGSRFMRMERVVAALAGPTVVEGAH